MLKIGEGGGKIVQKYRIKSVFQGQMLHLLCGGGYYDRFRVHGLYSQFARFHVIKI